MYVIKCTKGVHVLPLTPGSASGIQVVFEPLAYLVPIAIQQQDKIHGKRKSCIATSQMTRQQACGHNNSTSHTPTASENVYKRIYTLPGPISWWWGCCRAVCQTGHQQCREPAGSPFDSLNDERCWKVGFKDPPVFKLMIALALFGTYR